MATLIEQPTRVEAAGNKPKLIDEFIGLVNSDTRTTEHGSDAESFRLGGTGADAGVRRIYVGPREGAACGNQGRNHSCPGRAGGHDRIEANGFDIVRRDRKEPSTLPCVYPPFPRRRCIVIRPDHGVRESAMSAGPDHSSACLMSSPGSGKAHLLRTDHAGVTCPLMSSGFVCLFLVHRHDIVWQAFA